jgi:hypothetical protein
MRKLLALLVIIALTTVFSCTPGGYNFKISPAGAGYVELTERENGITTIDAFANEGYIFDYWEGGLEGYINNCPTSMAVGKNITAHFKTYAPLQIVSDDFETGDFSKNPYVFGGNANPFIQSDDVHGGTNAVRFGAIDHSQTSSFALEDLSVNSETTVSFYVKVDSETSSYGVYDGFIFYVDDVQIIKWDKDDCANWTIYEHTLTEGTHTLKWEYKKDSSVSAGEDTAWVDDIVFNGNLTIEPPKPAISVTGVANNGSVNRKVLAGEPTELTYNIQNVGKATLYVGDVVLSNQQYSIVQQPQHELAQGESTKFILSVNVGIAQTKTVNVMIPNSDPNNSPFTFDINVEGVDAQPGWLIMMYMDGDNNLEGLLWGDINEMEYGLYQMNPDLREDVKILVLWDGNPGYDSYPPEGGRLYELGTEDTENQSLSTETIDHTAEKWWSGDEVDMGDGATITEFINWSRTKYPGFMNEVFIMSNHGGGVKKSYGPPDRYGWSDDTNGSHLYTNEIQQGFINAGCDVDTLSIIGMDACIMSAVEEAYEYRNLAEFFVAAPENEGGDGWEYDDWLPNMTSNTDPRELAQILVESYRDDIGGDQCLTATDLSEMENLKTKIDNVAALLYAEGNTAKTVISSTASNGNSCWYLGELFKKITSSSLSQPLKDAATEAHNTLGNAIVYSWRGSYYSGPQYNGPGTTTKEGLVIEKTKENWYTTNPVGEYGELDFCTTTDDGVVNTWTELLNAWY